MKYQDIREAFPKCGIAISSSGISLIFQQYHKPQYVGMDIDDDEMGNLGIFEGLLEICDSIRVFMQPGRGIRFDFCMGIPIEHDLIFPPLRRELTWDEVMKIPPKRVNQDFIDVFSEVDLNDEESVLAGVSDVIKRGCQGEVLSFDGLRDWPAIRRAAQEFHDKTHFGNLALENPDQWVTSGSAVFDFESDKPAVFELKKDDLPWFINLVKTANWFSLDGFSSDERANFVMSFYS